jgi:KaiC/GvpD/RAD55 family RecA-like ATPase
MQDKKLKTCSLEDLLKRQFPPREYLLEPWLKARQQMMLYAPAGVGKSLFAWGVALAVAGAGKFGEQWTAPQPRKVLYVDGEMDMQDLAERAKQLGRHSEGDQGTAGKNLRLLARHDQFPDVEFPDLNDERQQQWLFEKVGEFQPELVVLDNFSVLCDIADENTSGSWNGIIKVLMSLHTRGIATILVHHSRKGDPSEDSFRGNSKINGAVDVTLRLDRRVEGDKAVGQGAAFTLHRTKYRQTPDPFTLPLHFSLMPFGWKIEEDQESIEDQAVKLIKAGKFATQAQLAEHFGHQKAWASKLCERLRIFGKMTKDELATGFMRGKTLRSIETAPESDFDAADLENQEVKF